MIDLNELDKEIDVLLENETKDSLTAWLLNKRFFHGELDEASFDEDDLKRDGQAGN